ncbi:proton-conducting transporter transmembrane domain-containing protein [Alicyclobacillus shizuokensis]|uniref:proton-conducting transporter transmembrane domain-containing protein n=1 Tax=Alicyclobacillus shizuokensis TaxID=392014 RepID=UPI0008347ED0|nr:proton-conducting transporter membrane subunit [Alicyclobacillus shizuokensis]MCL6625276.1 hypothetical protein [Alicyclobacillus shizuokensis]
MRSLFFVSLLAFLLSIAWSVVTWGVSGRRSHVSAQGRAAHLPFSRWPWVWIAVGAILQAVLGVMGLTQHSVEPLLSLPAIPVFGTWAFHVDLLSSLLFLILGGIGTAGAFVAIDHTRHHGAGTDCSMAMIVAIQFIFTSFLLTSTDAIPFLIAWEAMSLCAYMYILSNHHHRPARRAAYVTVLISELGFLFLVIAVVLSASIASTATAVSAAANPFSFLALAAHLAASSAGLRDAVFLLALLGFGAKSGVLPMQAWMPSAYDAAPPHLNAVLAGGLLNLGLFGILRILSIDVPTLAIGFIVLWIGAAAVFSGALFAVIEGRMRRLLAYSSVENVGLMLISIGLTIVFAGRHNLHYANVAMMALFVQMVSHAMAKSLAFLTAGEISHRAGSAELDQLGGLLRRMPAVGCAFLVACLTLAAVAPFSGFAAEWMTFQAMLQVYRSLPGVGQVVVAMGGMVAAAGAALAMTTFLKVFAFSMTGHYRGTHKSGAASGHGMDYGASMSTQPASLDAPPGVALIDHAHTGDPNGQPLTDDRGARQVHVRRRTGRTAGLGIAILAVLSALYGWFPTLAMPAYEHVSAALLSVATQLTDIVPNVSRGPGLNTTIITLGGAAPSFLPTPGLVIQPGDFVATMGPTYVLFWFLVFAAFGFLLSRLPRKRVYAARTVPSWLGGRDHRTAQSQYTSSAYVNPYRMFWAGLLRYRLHRQLIQGSPSVPRAWKLKRETSFWLSVNPWLAPVRLMRRVTSRIRHWQHGYLWGYMLTILAGLLILLAWAFLY